MKRGLTAIIVAHNSNDYLPVCLSSIYRSAGELDIQVLVVDNASDITPSSLFRDDFPTAEWIESDKNLGFGKACNLGVESAHHNNLFFINPDTYISTTTFSKLLDFIKTEENPGIVGCKILNGDGSLQAACRRNFPSPSGALFHTIGLDKIFPNSELFGQYNLTFKSEDEIHELDAVSGSFFWINKDVYKEIEGFDEDFFLYGEDLDLCYRVQKTGRKNIYYPHARVMHFKGHSSDQKPWRTSVHFYNAMRIFAQKHKSLTNLPYFIVELGIIFSAIIGSFVRIANSPKSFIKDGLIVALVLVLTLSFGVFEPVGAISWLGPALGIWFTSSFFSGEFRGKGKWDKIEIFKKTDFVFGAITGLVVFLISQTLAPVLITSLWWVLRFFYRTNQKIIRYYVSKTNSALTIGELSPVELRNLKNQVAYDWIGKIDVYGEKEEKDPFCLGSGPDLYKFQKSLGISHLVLQPRTFITAQKVLFCEELELNSRAINLLFPCLQGKTFVEINLRILQ